MVFRKSWTSFAAVSVRIAFWLLICLLVLVFNDQIHGWLTDNGSTPGTIKFLSLLTAAFVAYRLLKLTWHFFWLRSFRIVIGDDAVWVYHGILPWRKFQRSWDGDQMHECLVSSSGFMNWLLRAGDVVIVGSEGSTHKYIMSRIGQAETACKEINLMRQKSRAQFRRS